MAKDKYILEQISLCHLVACSFAPSKLKSIVGSIFCLILGVPKRVAMQGVTEQALIWCQPVINVPSLQKE